MKAFFEGLNEFFKNLAKSLRELADSRRATLIAIGVIVTVVAELLPEYRETAVRIAHVIDIGLGALAALLTVRPGQTEDAKG